MFAGTDLWILSSRPTRDTKDVAFRLMNASDAMGLRDRTRYDNWEIRTESAEIRRNRGTQFGN